MREGLRHRSWFALLRRDRVAFFLAATFLIIAHLLQPLASAEFVGLGNAGTICSVVDASPSAPVGSREPAADHCPQCVAGPCAGLALATREGAVALAAPRPASDSRKPAYGTAALRSGLAGEPPPAIRAPPSLV
jgi:hypothetical protein